MNPIKTPQEMLAELGGIPHFVSGGQVSAAVMQLIQKARKLLGRELTQAEIREIESLSRPTSRGVPTNPARLAGTTPGVNQLADASGFLYNPMQGKRGLTTPEQAKGYTLDPFGSSKGNRAAREGQYDNYKKAFEERDPFLTEAATGRKPSGTYQKPFTTNIDDLAANKAQLESKGIYQGHTGTEAGGLPVQSTTPSADFFAQRSSALENAALPDNLVEMLRQKLGRNPTEDEVNSFIANLNVMGHDYTGQGAAAFANTRPFPKGRPTKEEAEAIAAYRQNAIDSGVSPSATTAGGAELRRDYPNLMKEREWGPESGMKTGGSVDELRHLMVAYGHEPQHFKEGKNVVPWKTKAAKFGMPIAINAPFAAADIASLSKNIGNKKYANAAEDVAGMVLDYLPYTPLTVALGNLRPTELGDATLDNWNAQKEYERQLHLKNIYEKSPVIAREKPNYTPIESLNELGYPKE